MPGSGDRLSELACISEVRRCRCSEGPHGFFEQGLDRSFIGPILGVVRGPVLNNGSRHH